MLYSNMSLNCAGLLIDVMKMRVHVDCVCVYTWPWGLYIQVTEVARENVKKVVARGDDLDDLQQRAGTRTISLFI